jgi:hypothetical protein
MITHVGVGGFILSSLVFLPPRYEEDFQDEYNPEEELEFGGDGAGGEGEEDGLGGEDDEAAAVAGGDWDARAGRTGPGDATTGGRRGTKTTPAASNPVDPFTAATDAGLVLDPSAVSSSSLTAFVPVEDRVTTRFMTKYERARLLGTRALQLR